MKILFLNDPPQAVREEFYTQNWQIDILKNIDDLPEIIADYDALVIKEETNLDSELLAKARNLKVIGILNNDILNFDTLAATSLGITIVNISKSVASSVAEYTIGQMLYLARLRRKKDSWELAGKNLGIIGFNRVSAALAKKALALDMHIMVYDPTLSTAKIKAHKIESVSLIDILISADFLSINISLNETAFAPLSAEQLSLCKENCVLINNSTPEIISKDALEAFLNASKMHFCAFDCNKSAYEYYSDFKNNQVIITENKATETIESIRRGAAELSAEMLSVIQTGMSENAINIPTIASDKMPLYAPFLKMSAALGYFLGQFLHGELKEIVLYDYEQSLNDDAPLLQHLLKYLLQAMGYENVNYVNSLAQAGKLKIGVYTNTDSKGKGLGLKVKLKDNREHYLHLILSENTIKINNLDRHQLNFELKEHMILLYHADKPGVVGLVGSMLGACSINIIDMNLDNSLSPKESALMLITLDSKVDDDFLKVLSKYDNIYEVYYINLPSSVYTDFTYEQKGLI